VAWKAVVYFLVASVIHFLEHLYDFWKLAPGLAAANEKLLASIVWPHFWATQLLLAVLIVAYCVMSELVRALGAHKVRTMFFGPLVSWPL
jgi:hypothetical protein